MTGRHAAGGTTLLNILELHQHPRATSASSSYISVERTSRLCGLAARLLEDIAECCADGYVQVVGARGGPATL
jgi:hypothetical protein